MKSNLQNMKKQSCMLIFLFWIASVFPSAGFASEIIHQPSDSYSLYNESTNLFVAPYCLWLGTSAFSSCQVNGSMAFTSSSNTTLGSVQIAIMQQNADDTVTVKVCTTPNCDTGTVIDTASQFLPQFPIASTSGTLDSVNQPIFTFSKNAILTQNVTYYVVVMPSSTLVYICSPYNHSEVATALFVVRSGTMIPKQPVYLNPLSPVAVPSAKSKNLIMLIHGWNSNPDQWAIKMGISIANQLSLEYTQKMYSGNIDNACSDGVETDTAIWYICPKDWSYSAGFPNQLIWPWEAYDNAMLEGEAQAPYIVEQRYNFIHFIAHSAGSELAHNASTYIKILVDIYNAKNKTTPIIKPIVYTTFLDAYDPLGASSFYGDASDWAEQYFDHRQTGLFPLGADYTRIQLPSAYNFDVTGLDENSTDILGIEAHAWPHDFYQETVTNTKKYTYGYGLSKEAGGNPIKTEYPRGKKCIALKVDGICSESAELAVQTQNMIVIGDVLNYIKIADALMSPEGTISLVANKILKLITGSPAWISIPIIIPVPVDVISFDYTFQRQAEGLLTVFFDDQIVYKADERLKQVGVSSLSGDVPIGDIQSGTHKLLFRLDAYNGTQSEIDISGVRLGKMNIVTNQPPIANAGPDQTVRSGSLVTLNGSGSDPDNGPSPLSFAWSKIAGPAVTLTGATTAISTFTPNTAGGYTFSLVVKDGASDSTQDSVTITVPKLGDIDLDGDVDNNDLSRITSTLNKPASGPNDLRDINGDLKIDALDTRKLVLLCTRSRCATQ